MEGPGPASHRRSQWHGSVPHPSRSEFFLQRRVPELCKLYGNASGPGREAGADRGACWRPCPRDSGEPAECHRLWPAGSAHAGTRLRHMHGACCAAGSRRSARVATPPSVVRAQHALPRVSGLYVCAAFGRRGRARASPRPRVRSYAMVNSSADRGCVRSSVHPTAMRCSDLG